MPIENYSVLKGRILSWKPPDAGLHAELRIEVTGGPDITAFINVASQSDESQLVYFLDLDYKELAIIRELSALSSGLHLCSRDDSLPYTAPLLDLLRTTPLQREIATVVPHRPDGATDLVPAELSRLFSEAVDNGATFYVFGSFANGSIVNVHMNQGSSGAFSHENGTAQDGGVIVEFTHGHCAAMFMGFTSQKPLASYGRQLDPRKLGPRRLRVKPTRADQHVEPADTSGVSSDIEVTNDTDDDDTSINDEIAELETDAGDPAAIRNRSKICQELFAQSQQYPALSGGDWIDQMSAKFNWWSLGIGAEKSGHSSLDHRVRARDDVRDVLVHLLDSLVVSLQNCIEIAQDPDRLEADMDETMDKQKESAGVSGTLPPDEDSELGEQMYYIRNTIEFLFRISVAIRKSGTKFAHERADRLLPQRADMLEEFRDYLRYIVLIGPVKTELLRSVRYRHTVSNEYIWRKVEIVLHASLRDAGRLTPVQERLINANLVRRNRIDIYRRKLKGRMERLQATVTSSAVAPRGKPPALAKVKETTPSVQDSVQSPSLKRRAQIPQGPPTAEGSAVSSGSATNIAPSFVLPTRPRDGDQRSVGTKVSQGVFKQDYPKCPASKGTNFFCPYCAQPLDSSYSDPKNTRRWRGHVAEDLSPYVCIYPECVKADAMYTNTVDLKKHLKDHHSEPRWICDTCRLEVGCSRKAEFDREEDWFAHTVTEHSGEFEDSDIPALAEASQRTTIRPVACPLCYEDATLLQPDIDSHIAEHLHSFALQALPWDDVGLDDETRASVGSISGKHIPFAGSVGSEEDADWEEPQDLSQLIDNTTAKLVNMFRVVGPSLTSSRKLLYELAEVLNDLREKHAELDSAVRDEIPEWVLRLSNTFQRHLVDELNPVDEASAEIMDVDISHSLDSLKKVLALAESKPEDKQSPTGIPTPPSPILSQLLDNEPSLPDNPAPTLEETGLPVALEQTAIFREHQKMTENWPKRRGLLSFMDTQALPVDEFLKQHIEDRQFVFFVEDNPSMKPFWPAAKVVLSTLAMKIGPLTQDSLDLVFLHALDRSVRVPKNNSMVKQFEVAMDNVGRTLDNPVKGVATSILAEILISHKPSRPTTAIVLTDGASWWGDLRHVFASFIEKVRRTSKTWLRPLTIQLITFGVAGHAIHPSLMSEEDRVLYVLDAKRWDHEDVNMLVLGSILEDDDHRKGILSSDAPRISAATRESGPSDQASSPRPTKATGGSLISVTSVERALSRSTGSGVINALLGQPASYEKMASYRFGQTIGTGGRGIVRQADGPLGKVAVKIIQKKDFRGKEKSVLKEIDIHRRLDHPNVVRFLDWFESRDKFYIVMELGSGDLFDALNDRGKFTELEVLQFLPPLLSGVLYLHGMGVVHRGLQPEKILYRVKEQHSDIMIAGFVVSSVVGSDDEVLTSMVGAQGYVAPEVVLKRGHGKPADMWSIGVITYTLLCGYNPWRAEDMEGMIQEATNPRLVFHERYWTEVSEDAKSFIRCLLQPSPENRWNCAQAMQHPWLNDKAAQRVLPEIEKYRRRQRLLWGIKLIMLANRLETIRMLMGETDDSTSGSGPNDDNLVLSKPLRGARFREVVVAKMWEAKHQEQVRKGVEEIRARRPP